MGERRQPLQVAASAQAPHATCVPARSGSGTVCADPTILVGAGDGARARAALADNANGGPVAVLVLDEPAFMTSVARGEWSDLLDHPRLLVGVGRDAVEAFGDAFAHDDSALPTLERVAIGDPALDGLRGNAEIAALGAHQRALLHALDTRRLSASPSRPPHLFTSVDRSTTALRHLARDMTAALGRLGVDATFHETDLAGDPFRAVRRLAAFVDAEPTHVLSFVNAAAREYGPLAGELVGISYWSSDPERYALDRLRFGPGELAFVSDRRWLASFAKRGISALHLPLASGLRSSLDAATLAAPGDPRVAIVGNLPRAEDVLTPELRLRADDCRRLASSGAPLDALDPALRRAVEFERTHLERRDAAIELARAGIPIVVYGDARWRDALAGTPADGAWAGSLGSRRESARAFRQAALVVNVVSRNSEDAVNMRAFDVTACGGLLVSSRRQGLTDAFRIGAECEDFDTAEELVAVVRRLLGDPDSATRMRAAGEARALRDHTWDARWRTVFDALARRARAAA
ncbi:MAG: glycosyltransferase [Phycisphaerae bacterium]|nr:glycosyltransferase [Phycisphaerae bacterium]